MNMRKLRAAAAAVLVIATAFASASCAQAKSPLKLSAKKLTLNAGSSKTLSLKGTDKKVKFKITSGKKVVRIKRESNTSVKITALKKGSAKLKATLGKQSFKCSVTVKANTTVTVSVNGAKFTAKLNNSKAAKQFCKMLPLTVTMNELNGNEKYHYFDKEFSGKSKTYPKINPGDLMIFGGDCLVLFYDKITFSPYEYIKIGKLTNAGSLAKTLGRKNVKVKFTR